MDKVRELFENFKLSNEIEGDDENLYQSFLAGFCEGKDSDQNEEELW